ncbi:MAG: hypothetical protein HY898_31880 [Deltaproteobacteria bacterium]|nr:hypothetical protein [Deltaproteobacteria bacterium]
MSSTERPTEWLPIAILGVVIISIDLVIVGAELISPSKPKPVDSSPVTTSTSREHSKPTTADVVNTPRPGLTRPSPASMETPEARAGGVPRHLPPPSPLVAPPPPNDPMPTPGAAAPAGLTPMPKPTMAAPLAIGRLGAVAVDGGSPDAAPAQ